MKTITNIIIVVALVVMAAITAYDIGTRASNDVASYPAGASFEVIHVPPQGDNHHSYTKEAPVAISHSCMRWTNMDGKMEIACGSIQIFGLEDYEETIAAQTQ